MSTEVSTDLIINLPTVMTAAYFTDETELNKIIARVKAVADAHVPDLSTATSRAKTKSVAFKVSQTKTEIIRQGKKLTEEARKLQKGVNSACNFIEEQFDAIRDEVKKPVTDWEDEDKARCEKHEEAVKSLLAYVTMSADHPSGDFKDMRDAVEAVVIDETWDEFQDRAAFAKTDALAVLDQLIRVAERREADAAELEQLRAAQAERDRQDAERRAADEAAAAEAQRVENERQAEEKRKADIAAAATEAAAQAEREAAQRIADAERAAGEAKKRAADEIAAAAAEAERKAAAERKRISDEHEAEAAEQRRRDADRDHRKAVNNSIITALVECSGIAHEQAMSIVIALAKGTIPNVTLKY